MHGFNFVLVRLSIHAPREGGDDLVPHDVILPVRLSIHAPREGGDLAAAGTINREVRLSIHAPREGGDSSRRSTGPGSESPFNPRPP